MTLTSKAAFCFAYLIQQQIPTCVARIFPHCFYTPPPQRGKINKATIYLPEWLELEGVGSPFVIHSQQQGIDMNDEERVI